jgi:hypothetical protein
MVPGYIAEFTAATGGATAAGFAAELGLDGTMAEFCAGFEVRVAKLGSGLVAGAAVGSAVGLMATDAAGVGDGSGVDAAVRFLRVAASMDRQTF